MSVALQGRPRGWADGVAAAWAFFERYGLCVLLAVLVWDIVDPLFTALVEETETAWGFEAAAWAELALGTQSLVIALCATWLALLVWTYRRTAREVAVSDGRLTLRLRSGAALELAPAQIFDITPISPVRMFFRLWWPYLPSRLRSVSFTVTGWYRIRGRHQVWYLAFADPDAAERAIEAGLGIAPGARRRGLVRDVAGLVHATAAPLAAVLGVGVVAALLTTGVRLATVRPDAVGFQSAALGRFFLAKLPASPDARTPVALTAVLERALASGNPEVVRLVIERGAIDGRFDLVGFDRAATGCRRAPAFFAASQRVPPDPQPHYIPHAARQAHAEALAAYLAQPGVEFRLGERPDFAALARAAECAGTDRMRGRSESLPFAYYLDAARRHPDAIRREDWDLDRVLATANPDFVAFAIESGVPLEHHDWMGRTVLMRALALARDSRAELASAWEATVERLRAAGADLAARDRVGRTVAYYAAEAGTRFSDLARRGAPDPLSLRTALGTTLLHAAAAGGDPELAAELIGKGLSATGEAADGRTPLHFARGAPLVLLLLDHGASVAKRDARGQTPLHRAAARGDLDGARALVAAGAAREAVDAFGKSPADYVPKPAERPKPRPKAGAPPTPQGLWAELLRPPADLPLMAIGATEQR